MAVTAWRRRSPLLLRTRTPRPLSKAPARLLQPLLFLILLVLAPLPSQGYAETLGPTAEQNGRVFSCEGMYGPADVSGGHDAFIQVQVLETTGSLNVTVFAVEGAESLGKEGEGPVFRPVLEENVDALNYLQTPPIRHNVLDTGFYCVEVSPATERPESFLVVLTRRNPYGELPAREYPKMLFYGSIAILYVALGVLWMVKCACHWRDILPVQHYISGVMLVLMVEMSFNYGHLSDYNTSGRPSSALLALVVLCNAARISISLFVLLIVSLGYGVVRPTLGGTMRKCLGLTYTHFLFNMLYSAGAMVMQPETAGIYALFFVLPLSVTMSTFYTWTFNALHGTIQHLETRKQAVKRLMYRRLWRLLAFSLAVLLVFFVIAAVEIAHRKEVEWLRKTWKYRWYLLDGFLNALYLIVFLTICYLWRPTSNNQRYGLEELPTIDECGEQMNQGGYTTGAERHGIKLREQRSYPPCAGSDSTINETAGGFGIGDLGAGDGVETAKAPVGNSPSSIFDIGDEVDDWLEHNEGNNPDHRQLLDERSRRSRSRSRSPRRSREQETTALDSKMS